jgi:hypothetical protein
MRTFKEDYQFGKSKEEEILPFLNKHFNDDIKIVENKFSKFDYVGKEYIYEVKSRTNKLNQFPDTLMPVSKVIPNKKQIFIFNFTDKIGYIEYSEDTFKTIKKGGFKRNFREDFLDKIQNYYFIPINLLKIIEKS